MNHLRPQHFILDDDHNPLPVDFMTWALWFEQSDKRIVAQTHIGNVLVSTVFIGLDHNFSPIGPAHIFETMIFIGEHGDVCFRCATWAEAEAQHERTVAYARALADEPEPAILEDDEDER